MILKSIASISLIFVCFACATPSNTGYFKLTEDGNYKVLIRPGVNNKTMKFNRVAFEICSKMHNKGFKLWSKKKSAASEGKTKFGFGYVQDVLLGSIVCTGPIFQQNRDIYSQAKTKFQYKKIENNSGTGKWELYYDGGYEFTFDND